MPPSTIPKNDTPLPPTRTPSQQSWSTIVSLVIIIAMIIVGAFYAWGKRISEERALIPTQQNP